MDDDPDQWPVGRLLRKARGRRSIREVAKAAQISEGWLRQIERGYELTGGVRVPARPSDKVLLRVAVVVGMRPEFVFQAMGRPIDRELIDELISEVGTPDAAAFLAGHGGSEGWPPWLEEWLTEQFNSIRSELVEIAERVEELERERQEEEPSA